MCTVMTLQQDSQDIHMQQKCLSTFGHPNQRLLHDGIYTPGMPELLMHDMFLTERQLIMYAPG